LFFGFLFSFACDFFGGRSFFDFLVFIVIAVALLQFRLLMGALDSGASKEFTIYVKNEGNVAVKLGMTVGNWKSSSASNYITLSWNRDNYVLSGGLVVSAVLTLSVSSSMGEVISFSFDITIVMLWSLEKEIMKNFIYEER
jgi:hypothetical protein